MSLENMFISRLDYLKTQLKSLSEDRFVSSYKRIKQKEAKGLLEEIEKLERDNTEMKQKLSQINELTR